MKNKTAKKPKTKAVRLPVWFINYLHSHRETKGSFQKQILARFQEVPPPNGDETHNTLSLF